MKGLKINLVVMLGMLATSINAQPWMKSLEKETDSPTYFQVKEAFEEYAEGKLQWGKEAINYKDLEMMEQSIPGYEMYKRWEYFYESRVDENGKFPSPMHVWNEHLKMKNLCKSNLTDTLNHGNWSIVGPSLSVPTNGGMGRINVIKFNPINSKTMWIGSPAGGLWKSINSGSSWLPTTTDRLPVLGISDIVINPIDTNIMYIATGDAVAAVAYTPSVGILKSTDCGLTWNTTSFTYNLNQLKQIYKLAINPNHPDTILAATSSGLYATDNAGLTWTLKSAIKFSDIEFNTANSDIVYFSTNNSSNNGIYKSINAGFTIATTQNLATNFASANTIGRIELGVTPINPNVIYALCAKSADDGFMYVYKSIDGGTTWVQKASSPNLLGSSVNGSDAGGNAWYNQAIAVSPINENLLFVGGVNVWKSSDGGATFHMNAHWTGDAGFPKVHADIHNITFKPVAPGATTSNEVYVGCDGGVFKTNNGGTIWNDLSTGLQIMQLYRMSSSTNTYNYIIAGAQDNGSNLFSNNTVKEVNGGDGMDCIIDPNDDQIIFASSQNGNFAKSTSGGFNFQTIGPSNQDGNGKWLTPIAISKSNSAVLYVGYKELFKSINGGDDFTVTTSNLSGGAMYQYIAIAPSNEDIVYACTSSRIYKTIDGGLTWALTNAGLPTTPNIMQLTVSDDDPNVVYAVLSNYNAATKVYKSIDGGALWKNITQTGLPNVPVNSIVFQKNNHQRIYVGTDLGVYYNDTTLTKWNDFNNNLPNTYVMDFDIHYPTATLYAATYGRGIWQSKLIVDNLENISENEFKQKVNIYPNPAHNNINISLNYQSSFATNISIFALDGNLVYQSSAPAQTTSKTVELTNFKSGTYLMQIANGNKIHHQKIVVMP